ncbi:DUF72 domain-containing protein [Novilysobacter erysipheiresistens]|uniref:DUF72 domain-containing protein n=1 Tax=Novilysobacter erysipheiresistens TaxID=1749332 RepID=A0ABU7YX17_9GAMM
MGSDDLFSGDASGNAATGVDAIDGIRVGIGGWTYVPWRGGNFYPEGLIQRRELEYASRRLSAIEINGTYYGSQKPATYARWAAETPPGFLFSLKAPRRIVQSRVLAGTGGQVENFLEGIAELGDRLGPIVWQFDKGSDLDRDDFIAFLDLLPRSIDGRTLRHVLDVRVPDFVDPSYLALVRERGLATVFTDSRDYPSFADITADFVYLRLMRSRADVATGYTDEELALWAQRARVWADGGEPDDVPRIDPPTAAGGPRDVFVYFISAAKERNPAAAMTLLERLRKR